MATAYNSGTDWGFQWDADLALNDTAPLVGGGKTYYDWLVGSGRLKNEYGYDKNYYDQMIWDYYVDQGQAAPGTFYKPGDWAKLDFNIAYNRALRDIKAQQEGMPSGDIITDPAANVPTFDPPTTKHGPIDIDGVHYEYAQYNVFPDGHIELIKDYSPMLNDIRNLPQYYEQQGLTSFDSWLGKTGNTVGSVDPYLQNLEALKSQLGGGNLANDLSAASDWSAQGMGITAADYQNIMADLTDQVYNQDYTAQQGLTPEQIAMRERLQRNEKRQLAGTYQKMLDNSLASTGSRAKYLMESDNYISQMRDQELQYAFTVMQEDTETRQRNYDNKLKAWGAMYQANQIGTDQFLENIRQNRSLEMQVIASQASTVLSQNQQYLQQYTADLAAAEAVVNANFQKIQLELGMDQQLYDMAADIFAVELGKYQADMLEWEADMALYDQQQEDIDKLLAGDAATSANTMNWVKTGVDIAMFAINLISLLTGGKGVTGATTAGTTSTASTPNYGEFDWTTGTYPTSGSYSA